MCAYAQERCTPRMAEKMLAHRVATRPVPQIQLTLVQQDVDDDDDDNNDDDDNGNDDSDDK